MERKRFRWKSLENNTDKLQALIEQEVALFLSQGNKLNFQSLKDVGESGLGAAIYKYYPDGMVGLKRKLGIDVDDNKRFGYWNDPENTRREAYDFFQENGSLTHTSIDKHKRTDLENAIRKYPGGISKLREDLNIPSSNRKPEGYWTSERIEIEARKVLETEGKISAGVFNRCGLSSMNSVIQKIYPGGWKELRKKLDIEIEKKDAGYWTVERIESESELFYLEFGELTQIRLRNEDRQDLLNGIRKYPTKMFGLKEKLSEKLGVNIPTIKYKDTWTNSKIEELSESFYKTYGRIDYITLTSNGQSSLYYAIKNYYLNGIRGIANFLQIEGTDKRMMYWTVDSIETEALDFYKKNGSITRKLLVSMNRSDLAAAIGKYPGYMGALKKKLGIPLYEESQYGESQDDYIKKALLSSNIDKFANLFGTSRAVDILYMTRPDFKGIPVEKVKGVLAEYLGNYSLVRKPLDLEAIEMGVEYLGIPDFQEALSEVAKDDCLRYVRQTKFLDPSMSSWEIVELYLSSLTNATRHLNNKDLDDLILRVYRYYESVVTIPSPPRLVDSLKEGRDFPDLNQQINIQEIFDKKRVLNADKMGLGKSVAPVVFKELAGIKQAVLLVPSNVISTWLGYLSDREGGYYIKGQAPKVLVVENLENLSGNLGEYEYIILAHEKLNDRYTERLSTLENGMMVVDEMHKLKNLTEGVRTSQLVKLANLLEERDGYLVLMSGTPVPNKVEDIAISLKLLYPERFKDVGDTELVKSIINGDLVDLRSLLVPRMQRKDFVEGELPPLTENVVNVSLSDYERKIYQILLDEDELTPTEKIRVLRQFLLNPNHSDLIPNSVNSRAMILNELLWNSIVDENKKAVVFVNGYINGVLRGNSNIFENMNLGNIALRIIDGETSRDKRMEIQRELKESKESMVIFVSGQTADVGVDFSAANAVYFYNEPWTKYDKNQQLARVYREGLKDGLQSTTLITSGTLDEGIHWYIDAKYRAVEKLLVGIPVTELEKKLLTIDEAQSTEDLEVNPELAEYYFSTWDRMLKFFSYAKEIGEKDFLKFLSVYGEEYANNYRRLENRSYYANANRVVGALIDKLVNESEETGEEIKILDIASGPQVLKKHAAPKYKNIVSIDINSNHFSGHQRNKVAVASFLKLPFRKNTFDFAALTLAWHYSRYRLSEENYERLEVMKQANNVLKLGGKLIITNIYSLDLKDELKFYELVEKLGFQVISSASGEVKSGDHFAARVYTLQKVNDIKNDIADLDLDRDTLMSAKLRKNKSRIRDSRKIVNNFTLNGIQHTIEMNEEDKKIYQEETNITREAINLRNEYGGYDKIPMEIVVQKGFGRIKIGKLYRLFKPLPSTQELIVVK